MESVAFHLTVFELMFDEKGMIATECDL